MVKIIQNYSLQSQLGSGVYSKVYRGINTITKEEVAVKMIRAQKIKQIPKLEAGIINEINILSNIEKTPYIVTYYDMLKTTNNFYFVYEYCNEGTLEGLLSKVHHFEERRAALYFKQMLEAFKILTKYNIMHRDIKPENILLHNGIIKLADFGFCKPLESENAVADTMLGSPVYMAPEILRGESYTIKADVWSLGVVLYKMLFGECPFQSSNIAQLINTHKTVQLHIPENRISGPFEELLRRMLTKEASARIDWTDVFRYEITEQGKVLSPKMFLGNDMKLSSSSAKSRGSGSTDLPGNIEHPMKFSCKTSFSNSTSDHEKNQQDSNHLLADSPDGKTAAIRRTVESPRNSYTTLGKDQSDSANEGEKGYYSPSVNLKNSESAFEKHMSLKTHSHHSGDTFQQQRDSQLTSPRLQHSGFSMNTNCLPEKYSKFNVALKNRMKCIDIFSMALSIARYSYSQAILVSYHLIRIVESQMYSILESVKKQIHQNFSSQTFSHQIYSTLAKDLQEEIMLLKDCIQQYSEEIPWEILNDSTKNNPRTNLRKFVQCLKLEEPHQLVLISQIIDYLEEKMLIKRGTYEKLTKEQMLRQIRTKVGRMPLE